MQVDEAKLLIAIDPASTEARRDHGLPELVAYLNRRTGEIVFLPDDAAQEEAWTGVPAVEFAAQRAAVENRPSDWVEIPQYDGPEGGEEKFIQDFLAEHGCL